MRTSPSFVMDQEVVGHKCVRAINLKIENDFFPGKLLSCQDAGGLKTSFLPDQDTIARIQSPSNDKNRLPPVAEGVLRLCEGFLHLFRE